MVPRGWIFITLAIPWLLHLHHGVEFVVHGEISTYWMDNHAIWCFTFVAFVHCVVLLWKHSSTSSRHFQSSDFSEECMSSWWYSLELIVSGFWTPGSLVSQNCSKQFVHILTRWSLQQITLKLRSSPLSRGSWDHLNCWSVLLFVVCLFYLYFLRAFGCTQLYFHIWPMLCR